MEEIQNNVNEFSGEIKVASRVLVVRSPSALLYRVDVQLAHSTVVLCLPLVVQPA